MNLSVRKLPILSIAGSYPHMFSACSDCATPLHVPQSRAGSRSSLKGHVYIKATARLVKTHN
eukprot:scaffold380370_cov20-Prasinocladus_malaysianus.AAC.1